MPVRATAASSNAILAATGWNEALLRRYDKSGPRYTSYPTALAFNEQFTAEDLTQALERSNSRQRPLSLYVHVPFCRKTCFYCACNKIATKNTALAEPYLSRLDREMVLTARHLDTQRPVQQLHWGGGTPTFLSLAQMGDLIDRLDARFGLSSDPERDYAIEIDPREADVFTLRHLQSLGFNRLSLGVQDFNLQVQKAINRVQPRILTETLIDEAHRLGFRSLNLDLIYGLPYQTQRSFADTLSQVIELNPARLSVFNYAHMPTRFAPQRRINEEDLPGRDEKLAILHTTIEMLTHAGYVHIGMDHFARPEDSLAIAQANGTLQRNFQGYSSHAQCDLIGLGVSAISRVDDVYAQNPTTLENFNAPLDQGKLPTAKGLRLNQDDLIRRDVIEHLMSNKQADLAEIGRRWGIDAAGYFATALEILKPMEQDGLLQRQGLLIKATALGQLLIRHLAMAFDTRLPEQSVQRYSKIV